MIDKIDITEFLKSDKDRVVFKIGSRQEIVIKEHIDNDLIALYSKYTYNKLTSINRDSFEFIGFFNSLTEKLYCFDSCKYMSSFENMNYEEIQEEFCNILKDKITAYAKDHYEELEKIDINHDYYVTKDYFNDVQPNFDIYFDGFVETSESDILNYIIDKDIVVNDIYNEFIKNKKESLSRNIEYHLEYNRQLENLYKNPGLWEINKNIHKALNKEEFKNAKTITITIKYDNDELTFKFDKDGFKKDLSNLLCFSSWGKSWEHVEEFLKQHKSYEKYGYSYDDCDFKNIVKIAYGRKVIYEVK